MGGHGPSSETHRCPPEMHEISIDEYERQLETVVAHNTLLTRSRATTVRPHNTQTPMNEHDKTLGAHRVHWEARGRPRLAMQALERPRLAMDVHCRPRGAKMGVHGSSKGATLFNVCSHGTPMGAQGIRRQIHGHRRHRALKVDTWVTLERSSKPDERTHPSIDAPEMPMAAHVQAIDA